MYRILQKEVLSETIKLMVVEAPQVARAAHAGQFVIVRAHDRSERIPLTIADFDRSNGTITLIFQEVGKSTMEMGALEAGDALTTVAGPLGHPTEIDNFGTVVVVGGGVGIAPIYPIAKALREAGNKVIAIIGARSKELLFWEDRMRAVADQLIVCTDDGSYARKALVTEPLKEILQSDQGVTRLGHRAGHYDEVLQRHDAAVWHSHPGEPEHDHGGRHRHVRRLPRDARRRRKIRMCGRAGVRGT